MAKEPYDAENNLEEDAIDNTSLEEDDSESHGTGLYEEQPTVPKKSGGRGWLFFIIFAALIFAGYKFIVAKIFHKTATEQQVPKLTPAAKPTVVAPPKAPVENKVYDQLMQLQQNNQGLADYIKANQEENRKYFAKMDEKLDQKVKEIGTDVSAVRDNVTQLQNELRDVSSKLEMKVEQNEISLRALTKRQGISKQQREQNLRTRKQYFVKAVIPGRAWITDVDGIVMTIAVGDEIPGYGKVTAINAYSGTISTSSGFDIQYAISDR
jgi:intracellular multiplication protein IcmG